MALIVHKYGGTSVGTIERIQLVAEKVIETKKQGHQVVVVVSAMSGETNRLLALAKDISPFPDLRELDVLLSTGEQVTIALLCMALKEKGSDAVSFTGGQVSIQTDGAHSKARIKNIDAKRVQKELKNEKIVVVAGFQGIDEHGNITTLGRGGSDTTAVAMATALNAQECRIYTDVDGVYTADPRIVKNAQRLSSITYEEMLEMASLGSKVLQTRAVEFAGKYNINLRVLSSFEEGPGTLITNEEEIMEAALISGIAHNADEAKLTVIGVPDNPGIASLILNPIAEANIEVDMIVQNVGINNSTDFTFTVHRNDYDKAMSILKRTAKDIDATDVIGDDKIVKISVVGVGMRSHAGVARTIFKALADKKINIQMISTSEIKVSVVVDQKYLESGVDTLHMAFGLGKE
ncbi:MAG: aspartate kinase [Legionellales bacterium]|nr:aspartate kinase [Legionellales bacterium]|tara:strand:+ start:140 stop:1357 length:1218 start_codon:yes stop_codon:yes gene_type:complete